MAAVPLPPTIKRSPYHDPPAQIRVDEKPLEEGVTLPPHTLAQVLSQLSRNDLGAAACVCRAWRAIAYVVQDSQESLFSRLKLLHGIEWKEIEPVDDRPYSLACAKKPEVKTIDTLDLRERLNLEEDTFDLPKGSRLRRLMLSGHPLQGLPIGKVMHEGLRQLGLSGCELDQIPDCVKKLPVLTVLDLSNNNLERLPKGLVGERLVHLNLSNNPLTELPIDTNCWGKVEVLHLKNTGLKEMPEIALLILGDEEREVALTGSPCLESATPEQKEAHANKDHRWRDDTLPLH